MQLRTGSKRKTKMKNARLRIEKYCATICAILIIFCATSISITQAETSEASALPPGFQPTKPNTNAAPKNPPQGMVWIPGGEFSMGAASPVGHDMNHVGMQATEDSIPIHRVKVEGFWMDKTEVTNAQFSEFVKATGYVTLAEKPLNPADFPGVPAEDLAPGSVVFTPPAQAVPLNNAYQWWAYVKEVNWRHPLGPKSDLKGRENYPVVHIAYEDAQAYAAWAGKRIPTEAEWEFAARGGLSGKRYPWGDTFKVEGKFMLNSHQGHFPHHDSKADGFDGLTAVAQFAPNGYGLYDVAGNVWEWTSDWYRPDYYTKLTAASKLTHNPQGPNDSYDPEEPGVIKKVHRGGSFLCTEEYCSRYMVGTRGKGEVNTGANHLGLRLVKDVSPKP